MENRGTNPRRTRRASCRRFQVGTLLVGAGLLSGCEWLTQMDDAVPPAACASMGDCPSGFLCVDNFCRQTCTSSATCDPGEACARQETASACVPQQQPEGGADAPDEAWGPDDASHSDEPWAPDAALPETATDTDAAVVEESPEEAEASPSEAGPSHDATVEDSPAVDASDAGRADALGPTVGTDGPQPLDDAGCPIAPSRIVLFSGYDQASSDLVAGTWQWDGFTWTVAGTNADGDSGPALRYFASAGGICGHAVMFGGNDGVGDSLGDQWTWDGIAWTQVPVPTDAGAPLGTDSSGSGVLNDGLVMFGGAQNSAIAVSDTWVFSNAEWSQARPAVAPAARNATTMALFHNGLLLLGGLDINGFVLADAWTWNGVTWLPGHAPPSPVYYAAAAALNGTVVLFGGLDVAGNLRNDTWVWDGSNWNNPMPATSPSARMSASMATLGGVIVLYGGATQAQSLSDTWVWDGNNWTDTQQTGPGGRAGAAMVSF